MLYWFVQHIFMAARSYFLPFGELVANLYINYFVQFAYAPLMVWELGWTFMLTFWGSFLHFFLIVHFHTITSYKLTNNITSS